MNVGEMIRSAERACAPVFAAIDSVEEANTAKVLAAFQKHRVGQRHFAGSEGYGYDDAGRDTLERLVADVFQAEAAILRPQIASGTHALSLCLFGLLKPGDHLLSAMGAPYDTLLGVIGIEGDEPGSLKEMGVGYSQVAPARDGGIDVEGVLAAIRPETRVILLQRSRGYAWRQALLPRAMRPLFQAVKAVRPDIWLFVDNCYGAFVAEEEPIAQGADVVAGSLIKNLGGGLAPTGGYIAGRQAAIRRIAARLTAPGIGQEMGSYPGGYRLFYQGLFMAPHTVAQALKTAVLAARLFQDLATPSAPPLTTAVRHHPGHRLWRGGALIAFCQSIQAASPVDSYAVPEPWDMPGYSDQVIMAAGSFVPGASIELSCDAPIRPPFAAYLQGALSYAHGKLRWPRPSTCCCAAAEFYTKSTFLCYNRKNETRTGGRAVNLKRNRC